jgi:hypothetical protein
MAQVSGLGLHPLDGGRHLGRKHDITLVLAVTDSRRVLKPQRPAAAHERDTVPPRTFSAAAIAIMPIARFERRACRRT